MTHARHSVISHGQRLVSISPGVHCPCNHVGAFSPACDYYVARVFGAELTPPWVREFEILWVQEPPARADGLPYVGKPIVILG